MPEGLTEAVQAVWNRLEQHAREAMTLTSGTADAFRDLCMAIVARDAMFAVIERDGLTYIKHSVDGAGVEREELKAHPLISQHRGIMQRVEAGMQRFRLAPMGKELVQKTQEEDPFAEFDGKAV